LFIGGIVSNAAFFVVTLHRQLVLMI